MGRWSVARFPRRARPLRAVVAAALVVVAASVAGPAEPAGAWVSHEPFSVSQWGLRQIGVEAAWDVTRGQGARVGIIDTGVDLGHVELAGRVVASTRCIGTGGESSHCGGSAQDDRGHGTHVAGIVAAPLDGAGVAGVAPEASLLVVKALQADGSGEATDVAAGIDWLLAQGVHVVNLSLSETISPRRLPGSLLASAILRAAGAGVVVVLAGGNDADPTDTTAFNLPAVIVGASDRHGRLAPYSRPLSTGIRWGLMAPGGDAIGGEQDQVISTFWMPGRRNAYAWNEGTSMAAPHVAGAAALLAARGVRGQAAVERLLATAAPGDCGAGCRGRLDAQAALGAAPPLTARAASNGPAAAPPASAPAAPSATSTTAVVAPAEAPAAGTRPAEPTNPTGAQAARSPERHEAALEVPGAEEERSRLPLLMVLAALALLAVTAATGVCSWRRIRADAGW